MDPFELNESYVQAVRGIDAQAVFTALESGADVNADAGKERFLPGAHQLVKEMDNRLLEPPATYEHTAEFLLLNNGYIYKNHRKPESQNAFQDIISSVTNTLDAILLHVPDLRNVKNEFGQTPIDRIVKHTDQHATHHPEWINSAAKCVVATLKMDIEKRRPVYGPQDMGKTLRHISATDPQREKIIDTIEKIHKCVRERLTEDSSGVTPRHADKLSFWTQPFDRKAFEASAPRLSQQNERAINAFLQQKNPANN